MNQVRFEVFGYDGSLRGDVWARSASEACTSAHKLGDTRVVYALPLSRKA